MTTDIHNLLRQFTEVKRPEDVFGQLTGDTSAKLREGAKIYRRLAKETHEDTYPAALKPVAREAFQRLGEWWAKAQEKIKAGTYGDMSSGASVKSNYQPLDLTIRGKNLRLDSILAQGAFSTVYSATLEDIDPREYVFVKVARTPRDNELLEREAFVLNHIHAPDPDPAREKVFEVQRMYVPRPISAFSVAGPNNTKHRANIMSVPNWPCYTLETLLRDKFPGGIEPRHCYWIYRRLLLTLWMAHLKGYVHGAVTPDHVLVYPEQHGLELLDWTCAVKTGEKIRAYDPKWKAFHAPEVFKRGPTTPSTDLYAAGKTMLFMLGDHWKSLSIGIRNILGDCIHGNPKYRPQDAEEYYNTFGKALGKKEYAHMTVP